MQTGYKALAIILGILMIVSGVYCMMAPEIMFLTIGWVLGINMIADAIGNIATWSARRRIGLADGWTLAAGIISLIFGIALVGSESMQLAVDAFVAYMAASWLILIGMLRIVRALQLRRIHVELPGEVVAGYWWVPLVSGILLLIVGAFGLANPSVAAVAIGTVIGMSATVAGVNLVATACSA